MNKIIDKQLIARIFQEATQYSTIIKNRPHAHLRQKKEFIQFQISTIKTRFQIAHI